MPQTATQTDLDQLRRISVANCLRQAGATLEELRLGAAAGGAGGIDEEVRLADASQAIHRALIALTQPN